ncbi:pyridoxal-phosphate dependent enzyme [Candidatus Peregrinibacteria bacterium]|nr:pyridoxal-phosphate dependent enzyme [Candidatus Peregrinibacteria bacterium]
MSKYVQKTPISAPKKLHKDLNFYIKRCDLHPLGSHKPFAAIAQVNELKHTGQKGVISTSGNAGISAAYFSKKENVPVYILASPKTNPAKLAAIQSMTDLLFLSEKPSRFTNYISSQHNLHNLRPSMDDLAIEGFKNLAKEIHTQSKATPKEIYTFGTSGASFIGLYKGLKELNLPTLPRLHFITGAAGSLGIKNTPRKKQILQILEETNGREFKISTQQLQEFKENFPEIILSDESLSSIIAALSNNASETSLVISTGKAWPDTTFDLSSLPTINSFNDCDQLIKHGQHSK